MPDLPRGPYQPSRVLLTGATGFLGRHTLPVLQKRYGMDNVVGVGSQQYDLMDQRQVDAMFDAVKPDAVVHYAAYSGGIGANRTYPADFYFRNSVLTALTFDAAARHGVKKLLYPMGGCSYPAKAESPISEDKLWTGYPQAESAPYSTAKMMGTVAARAYRQQHGMDATVIIPGNVYGEFDNYHPLDSHVIPAMIRRYHEAKLSGAKTIEMWGSGAPTRDFVYAGDIGALIPYFIESFPDSGPINLSTGVSTSIKTLAETIARLVGFAGEIVWDRSKPDGQMLKIFSPARLNALGLSCPTSLEDGLRKTIPWFQTNYATAGDGLRL
jgi:GDP-L-fucose synthase